MSRLDSVDLGIEREGLATTREVTDPGHVTPSLNVATGGNLVSGSGQPLKRYEFAIETSVGPSIFQRTKVGSLVQSPCKDLAKKKGKLKGLEHALFKKSPQIEPCSFKEMSQHYLISM